LEVTPISTPTAAVSSPSSSSKAVDDLPGDNYSYRLTTFFERTNGILLTIAFGISVLLLYLTATTAARNHSMLSALQPYVVDVMNVTNKTWGYGEMPIKMAQVDKGPGGHHHSEPSATETALDPQDTTFMLKDTWITPQKTDPHTSFPTTSDTLDELRPDEVVSYETNFLVKKHVSRSRPPFVVTSTVCSHILYRFLQSSFTTAE
jgi:hypothetical protein